MKKAFLFIIAAMLIGCQGGNGFGQGGKNAAQYVKEQVPNQADNIASIETIAEDSLLCDMGFSFAEMQLSKKGLELMQGTIKAEEYEALIDSISHAATDITYSWQFSDVVNDSLMKLPQYEFLWRKAYTVRVTMKSGDTREPRVLMDNDGITPRMMEVDMQKAIEDHTKRILEAQETLIANIR